MLSLIGSLVERDGEKATEDWARGGDTDQINGVASGECGGALANTYYYVRMMRSTKPEDRQAVSKISFSGQIKKPRAPM